MALNILDRLHRHGDRHESAGGVLESQERSVRARQGPEQTRFGVAQNFHLLQLEIVTENIGDAGVIRSAVKVPAIGREHEIGGRAEFEIVQRFGLDLAGRPVVQQVPDEESYEFLTARDIGLSGREIIGRPVKCRYRTGRARTRSAGVPSIRVWRREAHDGGESVGAADSPQSLGGPVEGQVARPSVPHQQAVAPGIRFDGVQVAQRFVIGGVEERARIRVPGQRADII